MLKFNYEKKTINECNPELIKRLKNPSPNEDFWTLENDFGANEVLDAMAAILEEKNPGYSVEQSVGPYIWNSYLELFTEEYCEIMEDGQFFAKIS